MTAALLSGRAARADDAERVSHDWTVDGAVTAGALAVAVGSEVFFKGGDRFQLDARWTATNGVDTWVHDHATWPSRQAASTISYVGFFSAPVVCLGLTALAARQEQRWSTFWVDALLIGEAAALDAALNQAVKFAVLRTRPLVEDGSRRTYDPRQTAKDFNLSFYSEHTSLIFSMAGAGATLARMRGSRASTVIAVAMGAIGVTTAYMRIAADEHHLTDVLVGALVGSAIGVAVPYYFHRPRDPDGKAASLAVVPTASGGVVTYSGPF